MTFVFFNLLLTFPNQYSERENTIWKCRVAGFRYSDFVNNHSLAEQFHMCFREHWFERKSVSAAVVIFGQFLSYQ